MLMSDPFEAGMELLPTPASVHSTGTNALFHHESATSGAQTRVIRTLLLQITLSPKINSVLFTALPSNPVSLVDWHKIFFT